MTSYVILHVLNLKISHTTFLNHRQRQLCEKNEFLIWINNSLTVWTSLKISANMGAETFFKFIFITAWFMLVNIMKYIPLTLWMLGKKIDYIVVCFLKPLNFACFYIGNDWLSSKQVGSQASCRVTWWLAWIQPVCISINAVPAQKGLIYKKLKHITFSLNTNLCKTCMYYTSNWSIYLSETKYWNK